MCEAASHANVDAYLGGDELLERPARGYARCRLPWCVCCNAERFLSARGEALARLGAASAAGLSFACLDLTTRNVPLGRLARQRKALTSAATWALTKTQPHPDGHWFGDHYLLSREGKWHFHRHMVVSAKGDALDAALALCERYTQRMQATIGSGSGSANAGRAHQPERFVCYVTEPWTREPSREGGLNPIGMAARALQGDASAARAFREVVRVLRHKPIFRGSGCLGAGFAEEDRR
ncbi:hypothetical protein WDZ92_22520 [Nostoc sp. NIES-2111]